MPTGLSKLSKRASELEALAERWRRAEGHGKIGQADRLAEQIIATLMPFITRQSRRLAPREVPWDEVDQAGRVAVIGALQRFDPAVGASFWTFVHHAVVGGMMNYLRSVGAGNIKTPAYQQERRLSLRRAENALMRDGAEVTPAALAAETGLSVEEIESAQRAATVARTRRFGPDILHGEIDPERHPACAINWEAAADRHLMLTTAIDRLPEREREVICRRFFEGETGQEIAADMGCTRQNVSLIEQRALRNLRPLLGPGGTDLLT
jgi:RNA polymerase sigma-B factor